MIYIRDEGETVRNGVNIYPWGNDHSRGFILKIWSFVMTVRYSKHLSKMVVSYK